VADADVRLCRVCKERPSTPGRARHGQYLCSRCNNARPTGFASRQRYLASKKCRETRQRYHLNANQRRIFIGQRYHSTVASVDIAQRINAHIKERVLGFKQGQQDREKTQGTASG
jgi:hypothetical protein